VTQIQRSRLLAAAVETVAEMGYPRMTVAQVIARARVSRKTFYDLFDNREACFVAVFDRTVEVAGDQLRQAYRGADGWREGIRAGLGRLLELIDEEPALARLCIVDALGAGDQVLARRARVLDELARTVDRGRELASPEEPPPPLAAEAVVGAVFSVLHSRLLARGDGQPLVGLLGPLSSMIVLPYVGPRGAAAELALADAGAGRPPRPQPADGADPLDGLHMRLTYRTLRVLSVVGQRPGASNRQIATLSGIVDQGQISKLLARLARLELVVNRGEGPARGGTNAWHLTGRGASIERASRSR